MQELCEQKVRDTSQEIDVDLLDLQDYKWVVKEYVDFNYKKQDRIVNYVIDAVLDEMLNLKSA
jgi:hypothetical protein